MTPLSSIDFIDSMNRIFPKNLQKNWNNSMDLLQVLIGPPSGGENYCHPRTCKSPYLLIHPENVEKFLRIDTLNFESLQLQ